MGGEWFLKRVSAGNRRSDHTLDTIVVVAKVIA
ncbi:hypothetical protein BH11MYX2_BH11MYX2_11180 [soil metagenome]